MAPDQEIDRSAAETTDGSPNWGERFANEVTNLGRDASALFQVLQIITRGSDFDIEQHLNQNPDIAESISASNVGAAFSAIGSLAMGHVDIEAKMREYLDPEGGENGQPHENYMDNAALREAILGISPQHFAQIYETDAIQRQLQQQVQQHVSNLTLEEVDELIGAGLMSNLSGEGSAMLMPLKANEVTGDTIRALPKEDFMTLFNSVPIDAEAGREILAGLGTALPEEGQETGAPIPEIQAIEIADDATSAQIHETIQTAIDMRVEFEIENAAEFIPDGIPGSGWLRERFTDAAQNPEENERLLNWGARLFDSVGANRFVGAGENFVEGIRNIEGVVRSEVLNGLQSEVADHVPQILQETISARGNTILNELDAQTLYGIIHASEEQLDGEDVPAYYRTIRNAVLSEEGLNNIRASLLNNEISPELLSAAVLGSGNSVNAEMLMTARDFLNDTGMGPVLIQFVEMVRGLLGSFGIDLDNLLGMQNVGADTTTGPGNDADADADVPADAGQDRAPADQPPPGMSTGT